MLKLGETGIRPMYLGGVEIQKAFLGEGLVYESVKPSRLPEGYKALKYIQSDTNSYLNPGITSSDSKTSKVVMDVEPVTTGSGCLFGCSKTLGNNVTYYFHAFKTTGTTPQVSFRMGTQTRAITTDISNKRVTVVLDRGSRTGRVDSLETEEFTQVASYEDLTLLARRNVTSAGAVTVNNYLPSKLYSCQIFDAAGAVARDLVPCKNPSGVVGMYDLINGVFYKSAGSLAFTAGPAVWKEVSHGRKA